MIPALSSDEIDLKILEERIENLLEKGANVKAKDKGGNNAYWWEKNKKL
jgi:hypothetical protein